MTLAAEDCTTGIALAADEFTDNIYITDLTQATFTAGIAWDSGLHLDNSSN